MKHSLAHEIASAFAGWQGAVKSRNAEWQDKHKDRLNKLVKDHMPHGSGFDAGTRFVWHKARPEQLVFSTSFHHMDEGSYTHWTEHLVYVRPSFIWDFDMSVSGPDDNSIKEFITDSFVQALREERETW